MTGRSKAHRAPEVGQDCPNNVLEHTVRAMGIGRVAELIDSDPKTVSRRLEGGLDRFGFSDLQIICRAERSELATDDMAPLLAHRLLADRDDDPAPTRVQDDARQILAGAGTLLAGIAQQPDVLRANARAHYEMMAATIAEFGKITATYLRDYGEAIGVRIPLWRRVGGTLAACIIALILFVDDVPTIRRPRSRRSRKDEIEVLL